ncbi:hypothetical protein BBP40_010283 [Aspergillus hancockii]|nr:hypothetical protein BBP40_010283 [Aspergillus hancockii]
MVSEVDARELPTITCTCAGLIFFQNVSSIAISGDIDKAVSKTAVWPYVEPEVDMACKGA